VRGGVYEITDQCLRRLDSAESPYKRLKITVYDEDGEPIEAITYSRSEQTEPATPSQDYLSVIRQGYREWGIA
jgi:gamma-glutamylcyclotransferase (GGCT)/AIG2-like uncharacterized protein YtfP